MAIKVIKFQNKRIGTVWNEAENCYVGFRADFRFNKKRYRDNCFATRLEAENFIEDVKAEKIDLSASVTEKMCSKCFAVKSLSEFSTDRSRNDNCRSSCKICDRARENNPEVRQRKNSYQRENGRNYYLKYRNTEKGRAREKRHKQSEVHRQYKKSERYFENMRYHAQKRIAIKNQLPNTFTKNDWETALKFFENSCAYCGKKEKLAQEHFIPISRKGGYTPDNIIPACKSCNSRKSNRSPEKWCSSEIYKHIQDYFQSVIKKTGNKSGL